MAEKDERNLPIPEAPNQRSEQDTQSDTNQKPKRKKPERTNSVVTRESVCAVFAMFSILAFVILLTDTAVFMEPGGYIHALLLGAFGYMAYPLTGLAVYNCVMGFIGKKLFKRRKALTFLIITLILTALVVHTIQTCYLWALPREGYLSACFQSGDEFPNTTVAGWFGALIVYLLVSVATEVGALVILSALAVLSLYVTIKLIAKRFKKSSNGGASEDEEDSSKQPEPQPEGNPQQYAPNPQQYDPNAQQYAPNGQPYAPNGQQYAPNGQPYAPNPQPYAPNGQSEAQPTPQPMPGYSQGGFAPQSMGGYTPFMPYTVRQRPGFTLPNQNGQAPQSQQGQPAQGGYSTSTHNGGYPATNTANGVPTPPATPEQPQATPTAQQPAQQAPFGASYSPFGAATSMQQPGRPLSPEESRRILFSGSPRQNYQDNLIFDGNASVHRRTSAMDVPPVSASYTEQYQQSVQNDSPVRPQKVVGEPTNDRLGGRGGNPYELNIPSEPTPTRGEGQRTPSNDYSRRETPLWQEDEGKATYDSLPEYDTGRRGYSPSYDAPAQSRDSAPTQSRVDRSDFSSIEQPEQPTQQPVQSATDSGRRHEYMDLFSPQNPRVFGQSGNRPDGMPTDEVAADRSSIFEEEPEQFATDTQKVRADDPYALRDYGDTYTSSRATNRHDAPVEEPMVSQRGLTEKKEEPTLPHVPAQRSVSSMASSSERSVEPQEAAPAPVKPRIRKPYVRVPLHYFNCNDNLPDSDAVEVEDIKRRIIETLEDYNVSGGTIASVTFGPTVTRYNVVLPRGVSPRKVVSLEQEIAMGLCREGVNIYPNVEDGAVSIEVPNRNRQTVELGCMFIDDAYTKAKPTSLVFAMGKDIANRKVYGDVCKMTHLLVAGSSGSGKSVFLGCLIISLITKYSPDELRLILIDPKKTEFVLYNGLPHLMVNEIISDCKKAVQTLSWAIGEMERRYTLIQKKSLSGTYVVNIDEYNANLEPGEEKLPKIVIIVDELADLMLNAKKDMEDKIQSLTQKARAAGIHLILATQRPSIDVITGVIKSNLPTRIAFTVATDVDSRVILDQSGAQKLLGKGDMVYTASGINTPVRVQSPFISSTDSQRVVNFIKENNEAFFDDAATNFINNARSSGGGEGGEVSYDEVEPVYLEALKLVIQTQTASISMLQRKCSIGFNKAGKIIEWMETMEYISPYEGAKARRVLITREKFIELYGEW